MNGWQEFTATMTGHLVWPVCVVLVVLLLRVSITRLVQGIARVKYAGAEFEFDQKAEEVRLSIARTGEEQGIAPELIKLASAADDSKHVGQIVESWKNLEIALKERVEAKTGKPIGRADNLLRAAVESGVLSPDQIEGWNGLRVLRNLAVHMPGSHVDAQKAAEFLALSDAYMSMLRLAGRPKAE